MTRQITIKLNEERFAKLFNELRRFGFQLFKTNSALAAYSVWFLHWFTHHKLPNGETPFQRMARTSNKSEDETMLYAIREFCEFGTK